jgi:hypothetical protein
MTAQPSGVDRTTLWLRRATWAVAAIGVLLRIAQFACNRSLWLNEAMLADNIVSRSARELWNPLAMIQVAPYGFLVLERAVVRAIGPTELALRLVPLLSGLLAMLVFVAVARRVSPPWTALLATALFALCWPLIYQSSEVKQYSTDVAVSMLLLWCGVRAVVDGPWREWRAAAVAAIGIGAVWLSYPALLTAAGVGLVLILDAKHRQDADGRRDAVLIGVAWAVAALPVAVHSRSALSPADSAWMHGFWNDGFVPLVPRTRRDVLWLPHSIFDLYRSALGIRFASIASILAIVGAWALWARQRMIFALLALPVGFALLASALRLYPLLSRVSLFLAPTALLAVAYGVTWLGGKIPRLGPAIAAGLAGLLLLPLVSLPAAFRADNEDLRDVTQYVATHRRGDDPIFVYVMADAGFRYYAGLMAIPASDVQDETVSGSDWRGATCATWMRSAAGRANGLLPPTSTRRRASLARDCSATISMPLGAHSTR